VAAVSEKLAVNEDSHVLAQVAGFIDHISAEARDVIENYIENFANGVARGVSRRAFHMSLQILCEDHSSHAERLLLNVGK
jgi:hypothetical protein